MSCTTEQKHRWRVEYQERQQGVTIPGFGRVRFGHGATVKAATVEEARELAREHKADPETMVPADARIVKIERIYDWAVTLRGKKDKRRRETFIVSATTEREALSNLSHKPAAYRFARDPRYKPEALVKIERLGDDD